MVRKVYKDYTLYPTMVIKKSCDICKKKFEGTTEKQVDFQIAVHKISKHIDRIREKEKWK